jgi:hypothetical protein
MCSVCGNLQIIKEIENPKLKRKRHFKGKGSCDSSLFYCIYDTTDLCTLMYLCQCKIRTVLLVFNSLHIHKYVNYTLNNMINHTIKKGKNCMWSSDPGYTKCCLLSVLSSLCISMQ